MDVLIDDDCEKVQFCNSISHLNKKKKTNNSESKLLKISSRKSKDKNRTYKSITVVNKNTSTMNGSCNIVVEEIFISGVK